VIDARLISPAQEEMMAVVHAGKPARVRTTAKGMVRAVVAVVSKNATAAEAGAMYRGLIIMFVGSFQEDLCYFSVEITGAIAGIWIRAQY
jgi:hypothetical protein